MLKKLSDNIKKSADIVEKIQKTHDPFLQASTQTQTQPQQWYRDVLLNGQPHAHAHQPIKNIQEAKNAKQTKHRILPTTHRIASKRPQPPPKSTNPRHPTHLANAKSQPIHG